MYEWHRQVQVIVDSIDDHIRNRDREALTLASLAGELGYSEFHASRKFREVSGMPLRDYLRRRRLSFALLEVRDTQRSFLDIAVDYGFGSHEAFTRAFKQMFGVTPGRYRALPVPVVLRTCVFPFDRYTLGLKGEAMAISSDAVKVYFVQIPAHRFLYVANYESSGYFDFWEKQALVEGQDCDTICGLLDSIAGKLDGDDDKIGVYSGQIMAHVYEGAGGAGAGADRVAEAYGIRLAPDWDGVAPEQMLLMDVAEAEYVVFEHGPFDFERDCEVVGDALQAAIAGFDFADSGYALDESPGRVAYFYFDPEQYEKRIRPVVKK
ncbi:MAG: helix-turn-helix transcriptional regulator [Coriobacteriia bacterium]|nr:helix-turn-helix transcriptional regulator [Coriobacteriia bacterium]